MYYKHRKFVIDKLRQIELLKNFDKFDLAQLGRISAKDARFALVNSGFTISEAQEIVKSAEPENRGYIRKDGFMEHVRIYLGKSDAEKEILLVFETIQKLGFNDDGQNRVPNTITLADIRETANKLGEALDEQDLKDMFEMANSNEMMEYNEFVNLMKKTSIW